MNMQQTLWRQLADKIDTVITAIRQSPIHDDHPFACWPRPEIRQLNILAGQLFPRDGNDAPKVRRKPRDNARHRPSSRTRVVHRPAMRGGNVLLHIESDDTLLVGCPTGGIFVFGHRSRQADDTEVFKPVSSQTVQFAIDMLQQWKLLAEAETGRRHAATAFCHLPSSREAMIVEASPATVEWVTAVDAARSTGIDRVTVYRLAKSAKIDTNKLEGRLRFSLKSLRSYLHEKATRRDIHERYRPESNDRVAKLLENATE